MKIKSFISILITIIYGSLMYYLTYPALNIHNMNFWVFIIGILIVFIISNTLINTKIRLEELLTNQYKKYIKVLPIFLLIPIIIICIMLINLSLSPLFSAKSYYKRIKVTQSEFIQEVKEVDFDKLPLLDRDSTLQIGDRTMGQLSELVSQFDVSEEYTQINYKHEIIRTTPLEYNGFIKWLANRKDGIKAYINVNSTTGKAKLIKLEKGMKYAPSAYFNENLYRKVQFSYPTKNIESINFEIDEEGKPFWIASVVKYIGVGLKRDVVGVIIFDPITGSSKYYSKDKVPNWVDHVYEADLVIEQVNDWGRYKKGFLNSLITQKGVVKTTRGYNYIAQDDDIYLYTGITSVIGDESNIGFILTNMRTKETKFYKVSGAEEYSAMSSAEGQVQQMKYEATFPLLINLSSRPTYLVSLKDNAGLVKMYAFVDVVDYQRAVVTDISSGIRKASENYLNDIGEEMSDYIEKEIIISSITTTMIDGNTYYYITDEFDKKYKVSIKVDKNNLPFLKPGDLLKIKYSKETSVITIKEIKE